MYEHDRRRRQQNSQGYFKQLISQVAGLEVSGEFDNAVDARNHLQKFPGDLVLLDIEMPGMSGIELSRNLGDKHPLIIFTTSKKDYAVEAFELNVVDYLVKPVGLARFNQAIERARSVISSNTEEVRMSGDEFIFYPGFQYCTKTQNG